MTSKEFPLFFAALGKLAVMYRVKMDKAVARTYFEALQHVPMSVLMPGMQHLLAHGGDFMPTASRILETVDQLADDRDADEQIAAMSGRLALDGEVSTTTRKGFACVLCEDTGRRHVCPGGCEDPHECPKQKSLYCPAHLGGAYTIPVALCPCAATNPELLRKRKADGKRGPRYSKPIRRERVTYGRQDD